MAIEQGYPEDNRRKSIKLDEALSAEQLEELKSKAKEIHEDNQGDEEQKFIEVETPIIVNLISRVTELEKRVKKLENPED